MPNSEEMMPAWAVRLAGSMERLCDKVDRVAEDVNEVRCRIDETTSLITGGSQPEQGLVVKVDRLAHSHAALKHRVDSHDDERNEMRRETRRALWSAMVSFIVALAGALWAMVAKRH